MNRNRLSRRGNRNGGAKQTRCVYGMFHELQSIARATARADKKAREQKRESRKPK